MTNDSPMNTAGANVDSGERDRATAAVPPPVTGSGSRWKPVLLLALLVALIWGGIALYSRVMGLGGYDLERGVLTYAVRPGPLQVTVDARGNVESASNIEVKCRVAGGSTILWIVEDGKLVEEGEEIVRLDSSALEDKLNSQRIVYEKALASKIQVEQDLEAAKISVKEYAEGTFVEQLKQMEADIKIALENLRSAENQLKYSVRMVRKGFVSSLQRDADEFAVERAKLDLDVANTRKKVLVEFTQQKTLKQLVATREAASAKLRAEEAGLQLEKDRLDRFQNQLKNCVITAPAKGMVVYANDAGRGRFGGSSQAGQVEEGAMVRESQSLVRLPDLSRMQVKVAVHESRVDLLRLGMPARIVIQDQEYAGRVLSIANQPERSSWMTANVKEYATSVSILGDGDKLRPGMTAEVTILVADLSDIMSVPVSSVVEQRGQFSCWVKTPGGPERRLVTLGHTNEKLIEIVDGVKEGDVVLRNPRAVVEEAREEPLFEEGGAQFAVVPDAEPVPATSSGEAATTPASGPPSGRRASTGRGDRERPRRSEGDGGRRGGSFSLTQYDTDGDGKLTSDELPERMRGAFDRLDSDSDGFIDASEIEKLRQASRERGGSRRRRSDSGEGEPGGGESGGPGAREPGESS